MGDGVLGQSRLTLTQREVEVGLRKPVRERCVT